MSNQSIKDALIAAGVKNLKEFGYPTCNADNILTDRIFSRFFDGMLEEHRGNPKEVAELRAAIKAGQKAL